MESGSWNTGSDRGHRRMRLGWACLVVFLHLSLAAAHAVRFTTSLDRDTITLGESARLSLTFEGGSPQDVPVVPSVANLQIAYVGPSSQFSFINGQVASIVSHIFLVTPRQSGEYTIPAFTADAGGTKLTSQPLKLRVLKPSAPTPEAINAGAQPAFLKLQLPKKEVYLGEVLTCELQFHFHSSVQNYGNFSLPPISPPGFIAGKPVQSQNRRVQIGNAVYTVLPLVMTLTPIKTGELSAGPITAGVVVELASNRRRRDPFFEQFGFFMSGGEQKQLSLVTEAEPVRVLPLPAENVPPGFNGAVGDYRMTVSVSPTNVATGDPITVRVEISGRGALEALTLPEQTAWKDFKAYPPTTRIETTDALGVQGTKTFEQVVSPESSDIRELPPFSFSFFNPEAKEYRMLTQPAMPLAVRPGGVTPTPVIAAGNRGSGEVAPPAQDIVHIKTRSGAMATLGPPLVQQTWFLALQGVPVLAWVGAFVWRKRADALANNPRLRRQRQVAQLVSKGLDELRRLAAAKQSEEFFATLFRLLQEQIGERLDVPASSITEAVVVERLAHAGLGEAGCGALHELFQACNLARYAPVRTSEALAALVPKAEQVIAQLKELAA